MKIDTTSGIRRTAAKSGVKSKVPTPGLFAESLSVQSAPLPQEVVGISTLSSTAGLLSIQEYPALSPDDRKRVLNSERILDQLQALQVSLISGKISLETLQDLAQKTQESWNVTVDPHLRSLFEEIEIRGAVELAKLETTS